MAGLTPLVTAEELERSPDRWFELVEGRLVRVSPVGFRHGKVVMNLGFLLMQHPDARRLGYVVTEVGFKLASNPDTVRAPDLAFVRHERVPVPNPKGFVDGPPDFAVEALSPGDKPAALRTKVREYLASGVPAVLTLESDEDVVTVYRPGRAPITLGADDTLDLDDVIAGFRCRVGDLFI
jgi:Uma2 family endonuclease